MGEVYSLEIKRGGVYILMQNTFQLIFLKDPFERADSDIPHDLGSTVSQSGQEMVSVYFTV